MRPFLPGHCDSSALLGQSGTESQRRRLGMQVCSVSPQGNSVLLQPSGCCVVVMVVLVVVVDVVVVRVLSVAHVLPSKKHFTDSY